MDSEQFLIVAVITKYLLSPVYELIGCHDIPNLQGCIRLYGSAQVRVLRVQANEHVGPRGAVRQRKGGPGGHL